ncbi:TPA: P2 family phage major capsid protein, partial [Escherichia coli]
MNLVMSDITRNKLGCYMAQQASLNNIPVSALVSRFTVEPSVQQRFENASKESTEFTKRINVIGVTDQKGEKILLDTTGPIARTNTSYDGTKRRNPNNVVDLKNRKYQCEQVNYDTFISYPQLDAWSAHSDFQSRISAQIARQVALDRIMIGFNGTSHADESNFSTNKLLQDVNVGWLEHIRTDASERVMNDVTLTSRNMDNTVAHAGKYANADALASGLKQHPPTQHWRKISRKIMLSVCLRFLQLAILQARNVLSRETAMYTCVNSPISGMALMVRGAYGVTLNQ